MEGRLKGRGYCCDAERLVCSMVLLDTAWERSPLLWIAIQLAYLAAGTQLILWSVYQHVMPVSPFVTTSMTIETLWTHPRLRRCVLPSRRIGAGQSYTTGCSMMTTTRQCCCCIEAQYIDLSLSLGRGFVQAVKTALRNKRR